MLTPTPRLNGDGHLPEVPAGVRAVIHVDLAALVANWRHLSMVTAPAECAAVVKANAYGLGQEPVCRALWQAGCRTFFVASLEEALAVRLALAEAEVLVLDGFSAARASDFLQARLVPVLSSLPDVEAWRAATLGLGHRPPAALMIDTGMSRLGVRADEVAIMAGAGEALTALHITHVMSHLACADEPRHPHNEPQLQSFAALRGLFPRAKASLANSAGIFLGKAYHFDLVRPGIALYGGGPIGAGHGQMATVVTLAARILQVRNVKPGESVGYGATWTSQRGSRLATVALGYADGYLRSLGGGSCRQGATAYIAGQPAPVVGRVSMDLITIDVSALPEDGVQPGDWVELIGPDAQIDDVAATAGTISYEILTRLGGRCHRIYRTV